MSTAQHTPGSTPVVQSSPAAPAGRPWGRAAHRCPPAPPVPQGSWQCAAPPTSAPSRAPPPGGPRPPRGLAGDPAAPAAPPRWSHCCAWEGGQASTHAAKNTQEHGLKHTVQGAVGARTAGTHRGLPCHGQAHTHCAPGRLVHSVAHHTASVGQPLKRRGNHASQQCRGPAQFQGRQLWMGGGEGAQQV
jgi:hypothetical protein